MKLNSEQKKKIKAKVEGIAKLELTRLTRTLTMTDYLKRGLEQRQKFASGLQKRTTSTNANTSSPTPLKFCMTITKKRRLCKFTTNRIQ